MTQPSTHGPLPPLGSEPSAAASMIGLSENHTAANVRRALQPVRFPGDDGGQSLTQMAERDLDAALQLLVDRAQYITGASGAAIALRDGDEMVCRASAGGGAPAVGSQLQIKSGLTGESVRMRQILRCDDAESDARVNRESCRALGIASVIVAPLLREQEVIGVFELLSGRTHAFEERDILALQRLGEMIQTAVEHAETAKLKANDASSNTEPKEKDVQDAVQKVELPAAEISAVAQPKHESAHLPVKSPVEPANYATMPELPSAVVSSRIAVGKCAACGFPVSEGRKLCVECEAVQNSGELVANEKAAAPEFLSHYSDPANSPNWVKANIYWIGMVLVSLATVAAIVYLR